MINVETHAACTWSYGKHNNKDSNSNDNYICRNDKAVDILDKGGCPEGRSQVREI